ncbi:MAG: hypothetical protein R3354_06730, partial [Thiohalomonadales bacterium]|nr:hypothetical protein [Thiohalomonadales bacterium]
PALTGCGCNPARQVWKSPVHSYGSPKEVVKQIKNENAPFSHAIVLNDLSLHSSSSGSLYAQFRITD